MTLLCMQERENLLCGRMDEARFPPFLPSPVGIENQHTIAEKFTLSQNYPNPFNPVTTINYSLPKISRVSLKIFDISGRLVRTLIDSKQGRGSYKVEFDGINLASGVYFYKIETEGFIDTKKMILVK